MSFTVRKVQTGSRGVPFIVTHDGRTIRYPDPEIKVNDTIKYDIEQNKVGSIFHSVYWIVLN
jgi:small subunit ribosomal protein S4e